MSTGAVKAGEAFVQLGLRGREKVSAGLKRVGASFKALGGTMLALGGIAAGAFAGMVAAIAPTIKAASDMQETMNKFNVVFGDNAEAVKSWSDSFGASVGRSKKQIADFMAGTQDLLVPMGFEPGAAETMSKQMTSLAVDLASFNNLDDADVLRDLQAAMTGSGEVMKKYGVIVSEAAIKQQLLASGLDPAAATEQQKALARMNIILAGTTSAQGDAVRSGDSFANQQKALMATVDNLKVSIGDALLPTITAWLEELNLLIGTFTSTTDEGDGMGSMISGIGDTIASIGSPIQFLIKAFSAVAGVFRFAQTAVAALVSGLLKLVSLAAKTGVASFILGDKATDIANFAEEMSKDLRQEAFRLGELGQENFDLAFGDALTNRLQEQRAKAKADLASAREEAEVELKQYDIAAAAPAAPAAAKAKEEAAAAKAQTVSVASLSSLEGADAFRKFRENKNQALQQKMQSTLEKIEKAIKAPSLVLAEVG